MRVFVRVDTNVSLSDFGSSVWGGSDDEGTTYTSNSKRSHRSRRSFRTTSGGDGSISSSSYSSQPYETAPNSRGPASRSPTRSASSRHGPSPLSQSWGNALCSRWVDRNKKISVASSDAGKSFDDAVGTFDNLSLTHSERTEEYYDSEAESEGSAHTRGPQSFTNMVIKRSAVALEDGTSIHRGIKCNACNISPIVGMRYHCASCVKGADFVSCGRRESCNPWWMAC
jgi:hypothetical protein